MNEDIKYQVVIGLVVGVAVGLLGGYYLGTAGSIQKAVEIVEVTPPAPQVEESGVNTLGDVETNPYENVKLNPFE